MPVYFRAKTGYIIGHFDLITKFDELEPLLLNDPAYRAIAAKYISIAAECGCIFEVNTGAISRGMRTSVYPSEELLHVLKNRDARITISLDSHRADTLDFYFDETWYLLRHIGFSHTWVLEEGSFVKDVL